MESHGDVGKVNISKSTYDRLKNVPDFVFESRGKIEAKGKGAVDIWFVEMKIEK
ncbi:MAG: adenylate cyclase [Saprospiraceae bacterium]|jgi:adenylate cyclase